MKEKLKSIVVAMNDDLFRAMILKVKPDTIDEFGKVYDQDILLQSENGEIFWVHDDDLLCDRQMESHLKMLEIHVWQNIVPKNIFKLMKEEKKIILPEANSKSREPEYYPIFYGKIIKKRYDPTYNDYFFYLDVGSGIVYIDVYEQEYNDLKVGDFIKVLSNIIDLEKIDSRVE
jgi:hypothetical protein